VLELIKQARVRVQQERLFGPIFIYPSPPEQLHPAANSPA